MDKAKLTGIPDKPGVYIFKDKQAHILYIGKARSLKKRVKSYFASGKSLKIQIMTSKIADLDYIVSKSEAQARLEEARLIRRKLPPYNTTFRDDKSFPLICISNEDYPIIWIAREKSVSKHINRLRKSSVLKRIKKGSRDPIYRFFGPYTNAGQLRQALKSIRNIFGFRSCLKMPKRPCLYYRIRLCPGPCIRKISIIKYQQIIKNIILILEGRQKDLINKLTIKMQKMASAKRFEQAALIRNQIQAISSLSSVSCFGSVDLLPVGIPSLSDAYRESEELKQVVGLNVRPKRIEAFDVSNISGLSACASMVSFYEGRPDKSNYRRFRIKDIFGIDDYRMLEEAVSRRYRRIINEKLAAPDLIIIDGGKGQLQIVKRKLDELGLRVTIISIAKQKEEIYTPNHSTPIKLKPYSPALRLIQRIRDEAHRFALAYHRILRKKKMLKT